MAWNSELWLSYRFLCYGVVASSLPWPFWVKARVLLPTHPQPSYAYEQILCYLCSCSCVTEPYVPRKCCQILSAPFQAPREKLQATPCLEQFLFEMLMLHPSKARFLTHFASRGLGGVFIGCFVTLCRARHGCIIPPWHRDDCNLHYYHSNRSTITVAAVAAIIVIALCTNSCA